MTLVVVRDRHPGPLWGGQASRRRFMSAGVELPRRSYQISAPHARHVLPSIAPAGCLHAAAASRSASQSAEARSARRMPASVRSCAT